MCLHMSHSTDSLVPPQEVIQQLNSDKLVGHHEGGLATVSQYTNASLLGRALFMFWEGTAVNGN